MRIVVASTLIPLLAGCMPADDQSVAAGQSALGEPMNGFPSAVERLGIMAINRARSDPATVKGPMSAAYAARPPVMWSYDLSRSARFHATNLSLSRVTLMHDSPCVLPTNVATTTCNGDPACACPMGVGTACVSCAQVTATNNGCGTATFTRIGYFTAGTTTSASGEVAAAGYVDPIAVVNGWMDEPAGNDGHRRNLTDQGITSNVMGYGRADGSGCFSSFDVSDSGNVRGLAIAKLPTAAVQPPARGAAGSHVFYATWADPAMGAPASINVVVDGACTAMARELGADTLNATYKATLTLAAGCHNYYVTATDAGGTALNFPTTGAIAISVGSATACASDFLATAPAASCPTAPPPPPADAGADRGGTGGGGGPGTTGTGGANAGLGGASGALGGATGSNGAGGTIGAGGSSPAGTGGATSGGTAGAPGQGVSGGCSCGVASSGDAKLLWASVGLLWLAAVLARRRVTTKPR